MEETLTWKSHGYERLGCTSPLLQLPHRPLSGIRAGPLREGFVREIRSVPGHAETEPCQQYYIPSCHVATSSYWHACAFYPSHPRPHPRPYCTSASASAFTPRVPRLADGSWTSACSEPCRLVNHATNCKARRKLTTRPTTTLCPSQPHPPPTATGVVEPTTRHA